MRKKSNKREPVDVCLILEGTYPYVSGGVSTWVHQLVTSMPEVRFEILHIGAKQSSEHKPKYEVPENVVNVHDIFLEQDLPKSQLKKGRASRKQRQQLANAARACLVNEEIDFKSFLLAFLEHGDRFTFHDLWTDPEMWEVLNELYEKLMPGLRVQRFLLDRPRHRPPGLERP